MTEPNQTQSDESAIRAQIDRRIQAIRSKDVDAVLSTYAQNVETFDLMSPLANHGADAVRKRLSDWLGSFEGPLDYGLRDVTLAVAGDVAFDHHFTHVHGTTKTGQTIDMWFRETLGYRRVKGEWVVVHQHSSVPVDMKDMRGRIDLKP
jgi:ketosteroid isomerase-like protein